MSKDLTYQIFADLLKSLYTDGKISRGRYYQLLNAELSIEDMENFIKKVNSIVV